jgi:Xaa-Pro dipeptidase
MRHARPGMMEYELEAKFHYEIYSNGGCRKAAYTAICACGPNPAILHYGHSGAPNDRHINEGDLGLLDMGAEYHGYVSDITCSYPIRSAALGPGEFFTDAQKVRVVLCRNTLLYGPSTDPNLPTPFADRLRGRE